MTCNEVWISNQLLHSYLLFSCDQFVNEGDFLDVKLIEVRHVFSVVEIFLWYSRSWGSHLPNSWTLRFCGRILIYGCKWFYRSMQEVSCDSVIVPAPRTEVWRVVRVHQSLQVSARKMPRNILFSIFLLENLCQSHIPSYSTEHHRSIIISWMCGYDWHHEILAVSVGKSADTRR